VIKRVLIANRGEIALRILRACRQLGLEAVVAYSEADADSRAVLVADEAVCIGPADAKQSYLSAPAIISAALATGCDAIHPGYGFLSENAAFAEAVAAHKLTFIGPSAPILEKFHSKAATRALLAKHGLPTIPGSDGVVADEAAALDAAKKIGYPVILKASAGGGGRGMRVAQDAAELSKIGMDDRIGDPRNDERGRIERTRTQCNGLIGLVIAGDRDDRPALGARNSGIAQDFRATCIASAGQRHTQEGLHRHRIQTTRVDVDDHDPYPQRVECLDDLLPTAPVAAHHTIRLTQVRDAPHEK
jgi:hypothetical protein